MSEQRERTPASISFGALVEPIHVQMGLPKRLCTGVQNIADAITLLKISGIVPEGQVHQARRRLVRRIAELIEGYQKNKAGRHG